MKFRALLIFVALSTLIAANLGCSSGSSKAGSAKAAPAPSATRLPSLTSQAKSNPTQAPLDVPSLTVTEVKEKLARNENLVLVDIRPEDKFKAGHLPGAKFIPLAELGTRYDELPRSKEIIVYSDCK